MNASTITTLCTRTALLTFGWLAFNCNAAVFYGGQTKGLPGESVELTINVEAGTVLDAIDIVPYLEGVAGILNFVSLTPTSALTDDGSGACIPQACTFYYLIETSPGIFGPKTFVDEVSLATLRFDIDLSAPVGPVLFDAGVYVDAVYLPIPDGAGFEVLAIPEPASVALLLLGLLAMAGVLRRGAGDGVRRPVLALSGSGSGTC